MTWCSQLGNQRLLLLAEGECYVFCLNTNMIWWNDPSFPTLPLSLGRKSGSFVPVSPLILCQIITSKGNCIERRGCPRGETPISVVIFSVWKVLNLWWPQIFQNLLSVLSFLSSGDCLTHCFSPLQSFCQHCISSCSMHWYFKDLFSPSRWAALACLHIFC